MRRLIAPLLITLALLAGCQEDAVTPPGGAPPSEAGALVFRMTNSPGFGPPGSRLAAQTVALYGDGRLITLPPANGAMPTPTQRRLTPAGIGKLVAAAEAAGLGDRADPGDPGLPDAPVTTFSLVTEGTRHDTAITAIGAEADVLGSLTADQRAARERIRVFSAYLARLEGNLGGELGAPEAYGYDRLMAFALPDDGAGSSDGIRTWPLGDLATAGTPLETGRCQVVGGEELATLRAASEGNRAVQSWRSGERRYLVTLRAMLPDEHGCPV